MTVRHALAALIGGGPLQPPLPPRVYESALWERQLLGWVDVELADSSAWQPKQRARSVCTVQRLAPPVNPPNPQNGSENDDV